MQNSGTEGPPEVGGPSLKTANKVKSGVESMRWEGSRDPSTAFLFRADRSNIILFLKITRAYLAPRPRAARWQLAKKRAGSQFWTPCMPPARPTRSAVDFYNNGGLGEGCRDCCLARCSCLWGGPSLGHFEHFDCRKLRVSVQFSR